MYSRGTIREACQFLQEVWIASPQAISCLRSGIAPSRKVVVICPVGRQDIRHDPGGAFAIPDRESATDAGYGPWNPGIGEDIEHPTHVDCDH
jgi:hypothetical protein